jgi:hypothetical protein
MDDTSRFAKRQGRKYRFADPATVAKLTNGWWNGSQGEGHCPCHDDRHPSLRFRWGRNGGTMLTCHAGCSFEFLAEWFRKQGYWLDPIQPDINPKKSRKPVTVETSAAFAALSLNERRMFEMIKAGLNPTYNEFEAAGVRREAIPKGIHILGGLGLIEASQTRGRLGYERNVYLMIEDWRSLEPASAKDRKAAVQRARDLAGLIRLGRERHNKTTPFAGMSENGRAADSEKSVVRGAANSAEEMDSQFYDFSTTYSGVRGTATGVPARGTENSTTTLRVEEDNHYPPYGGEALSLRSPEDRDLHHREMLGSRDDDPAPEPMVSAVGVSALQTIAQGITTLAADEIAALPEIGGFGLIRRVGLGRFEPTEAGWELLWSIRDREDSDAAAGDEA